MNEEKGPPFPISMIDLKLKDGKVLKQVVISTGNNAAWICPCEQRKIPLIGETLHSTCVATCDKCRRMYRLVGKVGSNPDYVEEI